MSERKRPFPVITAYFKQESPTRIQEFRHKKIAGMTAQNEFWVWYICLKMRKWLQGFKPDTQPSVVPKVATCDAKDTDFGGVGNMLAAARLGVEIADLDNPYLI